MKYIHNFKLILLIISASLFGILILFATSNIIFLPHDTDEPYQTVGTIKTIDKQQLSFINSDSTENILVPKKKINTINIFDPYTHGNKTLSFDELSKNDKIVINCPKLCEIIKMPPIYFIGVIQETSEEKTTIISNSNTYSFVINDKTLYLDPNKNIITKSSITSNQIVFIYSDYSATPNQIENIPTASIQILQ